MSKCAECSHAASDHGDRAIVPCYVAPNYIEPHTLFADEHWNAQRAHSAARCNCPGYRPET